MEWHEVLDGNKFCTTASGENYTYRIEKVCSPHDGKSYYNLWMLSSYRNYLFATYDDIRKAMKMAWRFENGW